MRASARGLAAIGAVGIAVMTGTVGCSSSDKPKPTKAEPIEVATDNKAYPDRLLQLKNAQYVRINGLADQAQATKINQALHGPLDWAADWTKTSLDADQRTECAGKSSTLATTVRFGLKGPEIVSVANALEMTPCFEVDGGLPIVTVSVDLKAGKPLTAEDIFLPKTLTPAGLKTLWGKLAGDKSDWEGCEQDAMARKDFFPAKLDPEDAVASPAPINVLLMPGGIELYYSTAGSTCNYFKFSADYAKIKDLLRPELAARLVK